MFIRLFHSELILLVLLSSSAFGEMKSKEYYKEVIVSGIFDCNTKCQEHKLQYEINDLSYRVMNEVLQKISRKIDKEYKDTLD